MHGYNSAVHPVTERFPFLRGTLRGYLRLAAAGALLLACCAGAWAQAGKPVPIRLWYSLSGVPEQSLRRVVRDFNASQQEFEVVAERKGSYAETLAAGLAAPRDKREPGPQLLQVYDEGTADMLAAKAYTPLYRLAAQAHIAVADERLNAPGASVYADSAGRLLAFPLTNSTPVLYINRDSFVRAGLDPDQPPKTWYVMQPVLLKLQAAGISCPYTTSYPTWIHIENISAWHNNPLASDDNGMREGKKPELSLANHLLIRHVSLLAAWARSELFRYAGRGNEADARFASGECAMLTSSSDARADIVDKAKFPVKLAQLPYYDDFNDAPYNTLAGGSALWVMSGNDARQNLGAARFLAYLAGPAEAAQWQRNTGGVPVTSRAYDALNASGYFKDIPDMQIPAQELRGFRSGTYTRGVRLRHLPALRAVVDDELEQVLGGHDKAPISALEDAVRRGNALLRESDRAAPPKRP
jgi:sn-glycerol 3-phosphate transport system substrate-binding protein